MDSSLLIADERERFDLPGWLRGRPPEPIAVSAVSFSEFWLGVELERNPSRARRRRRCLERTFRRLEIVPFDARIARIHSHLWAQVVERGRIIGAHDLIIAATALSRNWSVATFNVSEFENVPGLTVLEPEA